MIATFAGICKKTGSGNSNLIEIPKADCLKGVIIWAPFKQKNVEVQFSERATPSVFATRELTSKEDFNTRKQVLLVHLTVWPTQKPKIMHIFYWGRLITEFFVVCELRAFGFKI